MSLCCHRFLSSSLWHRLLLHRRLFCLRRVWNLGGLCLLPGPLLIGRHWILDQGRFVRGILPVGPRPWGKLRAIYQGLPHGPCMGRGQPHGPRQRARVGVLSLLCALELLLHRVLPLLHQDQLGRHDLDRVRMRRFHQKPLVVLRGWAKLPILALLG